ncbi:MAG: ROK family transcriptional regulator [Pyrinomonadaceae bacterium]|nr:ROK family transcriptional regulator [Pyrinomonadaceae bacterium]
MRKIDLTSFNVATSETARNINRRIVLDLIRTRQPLSRADLARLSGLQRSTISVITDQLVEEKWVTEGAFGHLPRGRKPRFLHLNVERTGIIGINVRPTETNIALADINARFSAQESFPTAASADDFIADLNDRVAAFIKSHPQVFFEGIGVSVPGRVDLASKRLIFAPNLGWRDVDFKTPLENAANLPVEIENAANACALAEIWFERRGENVRDLIAVTISEGIGTGIIANGQLMRGANGVAGEFGHVSIKENGELCKCGNRGCWEVYASNSAAIKDYVRATSGGRANKQNGSSADRQSPTFDDILRLAEQDDTKAAEALDQMAYHLGVGLAMLTTGIAPQTIVLIGEVTQAWKRIYPIIKRVVAERSPSAQAVTKIVPAEAVEQPRLRGSVALILQKHFGAPAFA